MKSVWVNLIAAAGAIAVLIIAWFLGLALHVTGSNLWVLRIGVAAVGLLAVAAFWMWARSKAPAPPIAAQVPQPPGVQMPAVAAPAVPAPAVAAPAVAMPAGGAQSAGGDTDDIDLLIREADRKLESSELGRGTHVRNLPIIFLVGETGAGKTAIAERSGLEPELLAGQVRGESKNFVPTKGINIWLARRTLLVEVAGRLLDDPKQWGKLASRLAPARLASVFGSGGQAPRAVVACIDCEVFQKPGGSDAAAALSRKLQVRLREISQTLGISFPLYVLLNKVDNVRPFPDYVRDWTDAEATEVVGMTLPIGVDAQSGIYAERETKRLTAAFDDVYYWLTARRPDTLAREYDASKLPGIYEFPRELRKLRAAVVQFLVDVCRPSQLHAGPFLRGFYFTGTRTVLVTETPAAPPRSETQVVSAPLGSGGATELFDVAKLGLTDKPPEQVIAAATQVFDVRNFPATAAGTGVFRPPEAKVAPITREVVQGVFLSHLFNDVLLRDRAALGASGASTKTDFWRRFLLAAGCALLLILAIGFTVSFFANRSLVTRVTHNLEQIAAAQPAPSGLASLDSLQRLEQLRQSLAALGTYERDGAPWHMRWGLYVGSELYPVTYKAYFQAFRQLLFGRTQTAIHDQLARLPGAPGPTDDYQVAYRALKAYLITTSNHDKSTVDFLAPVLEQAWAAGREIDPDRRELARRQFDFYSSELQKANPYSSDADAPTVEHARSYLLRFGGTDRLYNQMLSAAAAKNKSVNFNRDFPGSAEQVVDRQEVSGAYTKGGWAFIQGAIHNPGSFFSGEEWVLGRQGATNISTADLAQTLSDRYRTDFLAQWRSFLHAASVRPYASLADASNKLDALSGNKSPLLELFWVISQNTSADPAISSSFQPPQFVVPPGQQNQYVGPSNKDYLSALLTLKSGIDQLARTPGTPDENAAVPVVQAAASARTVTNQIAQNFRPNTAGVDDMTKQLMLAPITAIDATLPKPGQALNGAGQKLCGQLADLLHKYPFNPASSVQATVPEFNNFFQPSTGALWVLYNTNLKTALVRQGSQYVAQPVAFTLNPAFVSFFNRAARVSDSAYPGASAQPQYAYTLKLYPVEGLPSVTLTIDGQTMAAATGKPSTAQFTWSGSATSSVALSQTGGFGLLHYEGPWAVFQFFQNAERGEPSASEYSYEWIPKTANQPITVGGHPLTVKLDALTGGGPLIFQRGYFAGIGCTPRVVQQ
jgi:type VI secretion system protein ImpL